MLTKTAVVVLLGALCVASAAPLRIHSEDSILAARERLSSMGCEACEKSMGTIIHVGVESGWMVQSGCQSTSSRMCRA